MCGTSLTAILAPPDPYEAAPHLLGLERPVLLDSSLARGRGGRYSYLSADPFLVVRSRGRRIEITGPAGRRTVYGNPFDVLHALLSRYVLERQPDLPPFVGGAIGYFGYDLGRLLERLPNSNPADGSLPDLDVGLYDWVLASDHLTGENWLMAMGLPTGTLKAARARLDGIVALFDAPPARRSPAAEPTTPRLRSNFRRADYLGAVERAKEYVRAGDAYQVNLSHRLEGEWRGDDWALYERLREASPVPYGAYLDLGDIKVLSASPERFLRLDNRRVETRPIKGTRPRGVTPEEDRRLAQELLASEKDRAENLMIVDLLRNDLGKVCRTGSVKVEDLFGLEGHTSVWHLVSTVKGELREELGAVDLLRACFPGGSVIGCPKIRAMEIIEELEPARRGPYCGAIGYLSFTGDMDTSITIRTLMLKNGRRQLQVGGAVTSDSEPEEEYEETLAKGRAVLEAIGAEVEER
jgi:para-aminobenzoate synthetase component I